MERIHVHIAKSRNCVEKAIAMREAANNLITNLESALGIQQRWTVKHPEYVEYY